MEMRPQDALNRLIAAFEAHAHAASTASDADTPSLIEAEDRLRDAFFTYDDVLFNSYGVDLPFDIYSGDEDDDDEDAEDDDFDLGDDLDDDLDDDYDIDFEDDEEPWRK